MQYLLFQPMINCFLYILYTTHTSQMFQFLCYLHVVIVLLLTSAPFYCFFSSYIKRIICLCSLQSLFVSLFKCFSFFESLLFNNFSTVFFCSWINAYFSLWVFFPLIDIFYKMFFCFCTYAWFLFWILHYHFASNFFGGDIFNHLGSAVSFLRVLFFLTMKYLVIKSFLCH